MRPNPHSRAIAGLSFAISSTRATAPPACGSTLRASLRYDLPGNHPPARRSAPDFEFEDGSRLGSLLHDGTGLLVDFTANESMNSLSQKWSGRVKYAAPKTKDSKGLTALLAEVDGLRRGATDSELMQQH